MVKVDITSEAQEYLKQKGRLELTIEYANCGG
jgi:hypothetical protein